MKKYVVILVGLILLQTNVLTAADPYGKMEDLMGQIRTGSPKLRTRLAPQLFAVAVTWQYYKTKPLDSAVATLPQPPATGTLADKVTTIKALATVAHHIHSTPEHYEVYMEVFRSLRRKVSLDVVIRTHIDMTRYYFVRACQHFGIEADADLKKYGSTIKRDYFGGSSQALTDYANDLNSEYKSVKGLFTDIQASDDPYGKLNDLTDRMRQAPQDRGVLAPQLFALAVTWKYHKKKPLDSAVAVLPQPPATGTRADKVTTIKALATVAEHIRSTPEHYTVYMGVFALLRRMAGLDVVSRTHIDMTRYYFVRACQHFGIEADADLKKYGSTIKRDYFEGSSQALKGYANDLNREYESPRALFTDVHLKTQALDLIASKTCNQETFQGLASKIQAGPRPFLPIYHKGKIYRFEITPDFLSGHPYYTFFFDLQFSEEKPILHLSCLSKGEAVLISRTFDLDTHKNPYNPARPLPPIILRGEDTVVKNGNTTFIGHMTLSF